jgi:LDH2 family malate/lactate/ureidoglycolate dehydrogenase
VLFRSGSSDASAVLNNIIAKAGGGIAPLGGNTELYGGHKGYGLGIIVDLFCGILSGGQTSNHINVKPDRIETTHFFMAADFGIFGDRELIKRNFSAFLQELRDSPKADGEARIYTHGEKEFESERRKLADGVPVNEKTIDEMRRIASHHSLEFNDFFQ